MYKFTDNIPNCPNFQFKEFFRSENDFKKADKNIIKNIIILGSALQILRNDIYTPIHVTSGYRDPVHNAKEGGTPNSWHLKGFAVDCFFSGLDWEKSKYIFLKRFFTGVIYYPQKRIVHLDLRSTSPFLSKSF